jgi:hypothetical protein
LVGPQNSTESSLKLVILVDIEVLLNYFPVLPIRGPNMAKHGMYMLSSNPGLHD